MEYHLAHAAIAAVLIFLTLFVLRKTGLVKADEGGRHGWSWTIFFAIFAVMAVFNIVWPYS